MFCSISTNKLNCLLLTKYFFTPLLHIKNLFLADFRNRGFMLNRVVVAAYRDGRVGIGPGARIDEQGITFRVVLAALEVFGDVNHAAVGRTALTH